MTRTRFCFLSFHLVSTVVAVIIGSMKILFGTGFGISPIWEKYSLKLFAIWDLSVIFMPLIGKEVATLVLLFCFPIASFYMDHILLVSVLLLLSTDYNIEVSYDVIHFEHIIIMLSRVF